MEIVADRVIMVWRLTSGKGIWHLGKPLPLASLGTI